MERNVIPPAEKESSFITDRPVAILMVVLAAAVFGFFSYRLLPVNLMPELSYPTITVRTEYPGAAPEEVENDITRPVEEALGVIGGLQRLSSVSRAGVSDVILEFTWGTEMGDAIQDTLEKLDLVFLPDEAERPLILRFDPSLDPVLELSLADAETQGTEPAALRRLRRIADLQVKRALEPVKGVAAVRVRGGLEEEIHVLLDDEILRRTSLSVQDVINRLREENINVAGGTLKEGRTEYMVRTLNEYQDLDQMRDTVIAFREGKQIRLRDLGQVVWSHKERQINTRTDGRESVQIEIFKEADANMVALAQRIKDRLGDFDPTKPGQAKKERAQRGGKGKPHFSEAKGLTEELYRNENVMLKLVADRSVFIQASIDEVRNTALIGGLLAVVVLFLFLRSYKSTGIIAISIPVSLIVTFAPLNLLGLSLNIMSLGGLALGIGMLVDSSIVVLESIYRCREEGDSVVRASIRGVREVRMAVVASTLTTIAVFFPMVFVEGVAGQAFGDLGMAVVVSLLAALIVALFFIPMLASRTASGTPDARPQRFSWLPVATFRLFVRDADRLSRTQWFYWGIYLVLRAVVGCVLEFVARMLLNALLLLALLWRRVFGPVILTTVSFITKWPLCWAGMLLDALGRTYPRMITWALKHPAPILLLAAACLAVTTWTAWNLDNELLPEVHQGEFTLEVKLPVGTPLEETSQILLPVEKAILKEMTHIESLILTLGFDPTTSQRSDEGEHTAQFKFILDNSDPAVEEHVIRRMRRVIEDIPDLEARVVRPVLFSFRTPIEVEVHGDDLMQLRQKADEVLERMKAMPNLADVETTQRVGAPEVRIEYDRDQLIRYGLNIEQVAIQVRDAVKGYEATRFNLGDRRIPIVVRFEEEDRRDVETVREFIVNPKSDRPIPLYSVARIELAEGPAEVRRVDGRRVALVTANIASGSLGSAVAGLEQALREDISWPANMIPVITGQNEEWNRSRGSLLLALVLSVFLVYVIMAAQFESLTQPLVIMLTIPLAFFGTALALYLLHISLSVVVFLGVIMLAGIVVNNAIVLIDYINTLRGRGLPLEEAVVKAGSVRLRPILMTTATTVLGLLPMALGVGDGAEIRTPMAISVISGLLVSTLLTLLIIPSVYVLFEKATAYLARTPQSPDTPNPSPELEP